MTTPRFQLGAATSAGSLYALAGFDGLTDLASVERWDPRESRCFASLVVHTSVDQQAPGLLLAFEWMCMEL